MRSTLVYTLCAELRVSAARGRTGRQPGAARVLRRRPAGSATAAGASPSAGSSAIAGGGSAPANGGSSGQNEAGTAASTPQLGGAAGQATKAAVGGAVASGGTSGSGASAGRRGQPLRPKPHVEEPHRRGGGARRPVRRQEGVGHRSVLGGPVPAAQPVAKSGVATFKSIMGSLVTSASFSYQRLRTLADCDLVVVQGKYSGTGVIFDMFRMKDGKLMEHWDSDSNQASDSGGPTQLAEGAGAQNRAQVLAFIDKVLIDGEHAAATQLLSASFVEHRSSSASGPERPRRLRDQRQRQLHESPPRHRRRQLRVHAERRQARLGRRTGFTIYSGSKAGAIVEHWDSRRSVPASTASGLPIF